MPEINGFEFIKAYNDLDIVQKYPGKIYFLSATSDISEIERIKSLGSNLIKKPLNEEKIFQVLNMNFFSEQY
jgi:CheY-like chemotaxis protein